jgi:oxygen-independent coproporphyrinogen-3 oxidase
MSALYIHIPFCTSKCPYCSFVSYPNLSEQHQKEYVRALKLELGFLAAGNGFSDFDSVFLGGGTPTSLKCDLLLELLQFCYDGFPISDTAEISVEANPGTVDRRYLDSLRGVGVNRISFGVQSLCDEELVVLGRRSSSLEAKEAIEQARSAGFENLSIDLMYGIPGQNVHSWRQSLQQIISMRPDHLSCYQLTFEEGTPYAHLLSTGALQQVGEEEIEAMDTLTEQLCRVAGLNHYEISNYARPGRECRHNINYWRNSEYYAVGAGAVSCIGGRRERREENSFEYCRLMNTTGNAIIDSEFLGKEASFRETVVMGLRMRAGVCREDLVQRYGLDLQNYYGKTLQTLVDNGFVELTDTHLRLSNRGRRLANSIMAELV